MEMYGIFRIKKKVTMPRVAEYLVGLNTPDIYL